MVFDRLQDSWSIEVPAAFAGKTEGLCGMADGDSSNDFWVAGYPSEIESFLEYWLVDPNCKTVEATASTQSQQQLCKSLFERSAFVEMSQVLDASEYIADCASYDIPDGDYISSDWAGCSVFAAFAEAASRAGKCVEWRSDNFCAYQGCSTIGAIYNACAPNIPKTCENFRAYHVLSKEHYKERCVCPDEKVCNKNKTNE